MWVATGRLIATTAADTFKKVTLEMGGKSPIIVFDDADIDSAVRAAVLGILANAGQICAAGSRLLVQRDVAEEFVAELTARMQRVRVGDPLSAETQMGPVVCRSQYDKVRGFVAGAAAQGARTVLGGGRPGDVDDRGLYIAPTVIDDVESGMDIVQEEVFGPVTTVMRFDTEAEALANGSEFGLSSYVWTRDMSRKLRMTEAIGRVWCNGNSPLALDPAIPFSGFKSSGLGGAFADDAVAGCTRRQAGHSAIRRGSPAQPSPWPGV